ncbi:MAG: alpha/beta hydrolase [Candidatus Dormibacteria bacterium]
MQGRNQFMGRWYPLPPLWLEGRAGLEYARLLRSSVFSGAGVAPGEGRPVMLIPGFLAGDRSLDVMRGWLRRSGYRPLRSGINLNIESSELLVQRIGARLAADYRRHGRRVILIGQSRGGVLAFGVAGRFPKMVDCVVTLGSPLADPLDVHPSTMAAVHVARLLHTIRRGPKGLDIRFDDELKNPVTVPVTSIYSNSDGIVNGRACRRPDVESIEVGGSNVGMALNPRVYEQVARLLGGRSTLDVTSPGASR